MSRNHLAVLAAIVAVLRIVAPAGAYSFVENFNDGTADGWTLRKDWVRGSSSRVGVGAFELLLLLRASVPPCLRASVPP